MLKRRYHSQGVDHLHRRPPRRSEQAVRARRPLVITDSVTRGVGALSAVNAARAATHATRCYLPGFREVDRDVCEGFDERVCRDGFAVELDGTSKGSALPTPLLMAMTRLHTA